MASRPTTVVVTNLQSGPRGIHAHDGPLLIDPGQQRELDILLHELKISEATGWFRFEAIRHLPGRKKRVKTSLGD